MKREVIVIAHIISTVIAILTIGCFFTFSLLAEIQGEEAFIKQVKKGILFALPIMLIIMPMLKITGGKLAGKSKNPFVQQKQKRMKFILVNGITLIFLACFLYYRSHYLEIDSVFLVAQIAELVLGFTNLSLILINARTGFQLSRKYF
ncbi:hypothetical protein [Shivajiella indica]|uniref:Uncharacterized protein n=1 Tax=Shivajiella indica TaxID=872115 RepID=A0ABW5B547_9BACT